MSKGDFGSSPPKVSATEWVGLGQNCLRFSLRLHRFFHQLDPE
jgi:hypothetical protein